MKKTDAIEVISPGSKVTIGEDITATILSVTIEPGGAVSYKAAWWSGRTRYQETIDASEVSETVDATNYLGVGFSHGMNGH